MAGALAEDLELKWLAGIPTDPAVHALLANSQRRLLLAVGLNRVPRDVTQNLADYLKQQHDVEAVEANGGEFRHRRLVRPIETPHPGTACHGERPLGGRLWAGTGLPNGPRTGGCRACQAQPGGGVFDDGRTLSEVQRFSRRLEDLRMSRRRDNSELSVRTDNRRIAARRIVTTS